MLEAHPKSRPAEMELINCIELPVLVVNRDLTLVSFNPAAAKLLALTDSDFGRDLKSIQMFTGVRTLEERCEHVIASGLPHRVEVTDGSGSWFSLQIGCHKADHNIHGAVLTLTNVTAFRESLERAIEEREYTKDVINTIADALVIVDEDLRVQAANQGFYALFQSSREESQGIHFYHLGGGEWEVPRLRTLLNHSSSANDDPASLECEQEFSTIGRRTLLLNARPLIRRKHAGQMTLIAIQDITTRKHAMEALRESEERFRALAAATSYSIYRMAADWSEMRQLSGAGFLADTSEPIQDWLQKYIFPEDQPHVLRTIGEAIQTKSMFALEHRVRRADGTVGWTFSRAIPLFDGRGEITEWFGAASDVSERRAHQEDLSRLAAIVDSADDAIISKDLNGIIRTWNRGATRIFGYTAEEAVGRSILMLIPEDLHYEEDHILAKLRVGERLDHYETVRKRKNGDTVEVAITVSPIRDESGVITGASKIARDISDRRRIERLLLQSEKLNATGRMAASIAHEINNPLESLINLIYLARLSTGSDSKTRGYLVTAEEELARVSHLARQTLGYYRDTTAPTQVRVHELIQNTLTVYNSRLTSAGISVDLHFNDPQPLVASKGELLQVFSNVIANAIDSMGQEGVLYIATRNVIGPKGEGLEVTIRDNGSGIKQENLPKVFEPFFTTKDERGTGIGLWVTKRLIESRGGDISVESSIGPQHSGTTVTIFIPFVLPATA